MCRSTVTLFSVFVLFIAATFATGCADPTATTYAAAAQQPAIGAGGGGLSTVVDTDSDQAGMACTTAPADCSLRSAITMANETPQIDAITFGDHLYIELTSPLPAIADEGVSIVASAEQDVYVDGSRMPNSPVLSISGNHVKVEGLALFGPTTQPILVISGAAYGVEIRNNLIGDDDNPDGRCHGAQAPTGVMIRAQGDLPDGMQHAYLMGNTIECIAGNGLWIDTDWVSVGKDAGGNVIPNTFRHIAGYAIEMKGRQYITIQGNTFHLDGIGDIDFDARNNNLIDNDYLDR